MSEWREGGDHVRMLGAVDSLMGRGGMAVVNGSSSWDQLSVLGEASSACVYKFCAQKSFLISGKSSLGLWLIVVYLT